MENVFNGFSTLVFAKGMIKAHLAVHQEQEWLEVAEESLCETIGVPL